MDCCRCRHKSGQHNQVAAAEVETKMEDVLKPLVESVTMMQKEIQALRNEVSNLKNPNQSNKQTWEKRAC